MGGGCKAHLFYCLALESNQICYCGFFTERLQRLRKTFLRRRRIPVALPESPPHKTQARMLLLQRHLPRGKGIPPTPWAWHVSYVSHPCRTTGHSQEPTQRPSGPSHTASRTAEPGSLEVSTLQFCRGVPRAVDWGIFWPHSQASRSTRAKEGLSIGEMSGLRKIVLFGAT